MGFLAAAAPALGAISTGLDLIGSISQGNAEAAQSAYAAQVARNSQVIAQQDASYATAAGETQSYEQGLKERQAQQAITGGIAAGGIDVNTGSAKDVRQSQDILGQYDVEQVRQTAALQNYGYKTQATNFGAESKLDTAQAGFDTEAGWLKGLGSLVTGSLKYGSSIDKLFGSGGTDAATGWSYSSMTPWETGPGWGA